MTEANLFSRVARIFKSYANSAGEIWESCLPAQPGPVIYPCHWRLTESWLVRQAC